MKKLTAILLTGCLTFQMLSGSVVSVRGADFTSGPSYETLIPQAPSIEEPAPESQPDPDTGDSAIPEDTESFQQEEAPSSSEELPAEEFLSDDLEDSLDFSAPEEEEAVFEDGDREIRLLIVGMPFLKVCLKALCTDHSHQPLCRLPSDHRSKRGLYLKSSDSFFKNPRIWGKTSRCSSSWIRDRRLSGKRQR